MQIAFSIYKSYLPLFASQILNMIFILTYGVLRSIRKQLLKLMSHLDFLYHIMHIYIDWNILNLLRLGI